MFFLILCDIKFSFYYMYIFKCKTLKFYPLGKTLETLDKQGKQHYYKIALVVKNRKSAITST
nr:MAG TPA_asm: hypothetical protein [Caudoviricetes sp.]